MHVTCEESADKTLSHFSLCVGWIRVFVPDADWSSQVRKSRREID